MSPLLEPAVPYEPGLRSPQEALALRGGPGADEGMALEVRRLRALNTVETIMDSFYRGKSFRVGFADPPLGGTEAWVETAMVPYICDSAEAAGWTVTIQRSHIVFSAAGGD